MAVNCVSSVAVFLTFHRLLSQVTVERRLMVCRPRSRAARKVSADAEPINPPQEESHGRDSDRVTADVTRYPVSDIRHIIILDFARVGIMKHRIIRNHRNIQNVGFPILMTENKTWLKQTCRSRNGGLSDTRPPSFTCSAPR